MDPATIGAIIAIVKEAPDMINWVENEYALFSAGDQTIEELQTSFAAAASDVQAAITAWNAAKPQ